MITLSAPQRPDPKVSQRAENIVIYNVFCSYQEKNSAICDIFFSSRPKIDPKHWYLRCFRNNQKSKCVPCDTLATQHVRNAVFYNVFGTPSQKHRYLTVFCENTRTKHRKYPQIQRLHFPWQKAKTSKNTGNYNVSEQRFFSKTCYFSIIFRLERFPKATGRVPPHPPSKS